MEQFQLLDEHVSNLILRFGFLDVEDLPFATAEEVENAAALALQMAAPEELIEIAVRQSAHRHPHPNPPRAAAAVPARPVPRRPPPLTEPEPEDPNPGAYIDWQERNRILADSPVEPDDGAEEGGEDCIICSGGREPKLQLPCGCWFCAPCLRGCIRAGLRQGGWPPKCCEPLQNDAIRWVRRPGLLRLYRQVREEQETPGDQRVYCSRPGCAAFIPAAGPHVTADLMRCRACGEGTCRMCRAAIHPGRPCREEEEDEMLMDIMDRDNLASCPTCRRIVELWDGCNHITAAINGVSSAEGTGGAGAHGAVHSMEDVNVVSLCVNACFDTSKAGGRWITTHAFDHRERSLTLSHRQQSVQICLSFNGKSSRSNRHYLQHYKPVLCHDQCLKRPVNADGLRAVLPFVPVVEDDFEGHPANFDPDFGGALPLIDVGDGPEPDHIDPETIMANANGQARGQQRYYIMMFYADGNNTEVGDPNWRRDSPENMRRIREGDETEGRANRTVNNLRNRVTVDSDFRYPRANANRIEAWDLFLEGVRPRRPRRGQRAQRAERAPRADRTQRAPRAQRPRRGRRVRDRPLNSQGTTLHDSVPVM
ncbi:unnamed protein product [Colletotrichum noveboracense]|uniref:IBR domain-containing protein n=1 Tax=Colletotrichum noveboracense TaxID=2664923 RepID=A0A9W4WBJ4_9PEZI|nr:unnamed protein product [Colletotrichum noveboracense]